MEKGDTIPTAIYKKMRYKNIAALGLELVTAYVEYSNMPASTNPLQCLITFQFIL